MFYSLGLKQIASKKKLFALSVITLALGVGILFTVNVGSDMLQSALEMQYDAILGNVDYTVYRSDGFYYNNASYSIPENYIDDIRAIQGVDSVTARITKQMTYFLDLGDRYDNTVVAIDPENPDEATIGISATVDCDSPLGNPDNVMLEDMLSYPWGAIRPVVISNGFSVERGVNIGDVIRIVPLNISKAYATPSELADIHNNVTNVDDFNDGYMENPDRFVEFTVVGIIVDGSEGIEKPVPDQELSFGGFMPHEESMYIRLNDSYQWVFNDYPEEVAYFLVRTDDSFQGVDAFHDTFTLRNATITITGTDLHYIIRDYVNYALTLVRVILAAFTITSWIGCGVLIKTTTQMSIDRTMREIGILRAVGFRKKSISEMLFSQLLVTSALGTGIGMLIGLVPPQFFDLKTIARMLSYSKVYEVSTDVGLTVSPLSLAITIISGVMMPFIFAAMPITKISKWSIVELMAPSYMHARRGKGSGAKFFHKIAMLEEIAGMEGPRGNAARMKLAKVRKKESRWIKRQKKKRQINPKPVIAWMIIVIVSFVAFYLGAQNMMDNDSFRIDFDMVWYWILAFGAGMLFFMIGIVVIGGSGLGSVSSFVSRLLSRRIGPISTVIPSSVKANTPRMKNMIGSILLGMSLVTSIVVLSVSITRGNTAMNRTYLGGDFIRFNPDFNRDDLDAIRDVEGVADATTYMQVVMDGWKFMPSTTMNIIVNRFDGYGGKHGNVTESLNVVIIDVDEYIRMNPQISMLYVEFADSIDSVYRIDAPDSYESPANFMGRLREPGTVIVQTPLLDDLGKNIGDTALLNILGFEGTVRIVGAATNLPAVPFMKFTDTVDEDDVNKAMHRSIVVSRETVMGMLDSFIGKVDIMMKNMSVESLVAQYTNESIPADLAGYTSGLMPEATRNVITPLIHAVPGVDHVAYRFSTFAPLVPPVSVSIDQSRFAWLHPNSTLNESTTMTLPNRLYIVDGDSDAYFQGAQEKVSVANPWFGGTFTGLPEYGWSTGPRNATATEVLNTIDRVIGTGTSGDVIRDTYFHGNPICVTNEYIAMYEDIDNETYVYRIAPGDILTTNFTKPDNSTAMVNFTVAAVLDNHVTYWLNNGTEREGYRFSSKTLNYDFNFQGTDSIDFNLFNMFDIDAQVIFTTFNEIQKAAGAPFSPQELRDLPNHAYISVDNSMINDTYTMQDVVNNIKVAINAIALNFSVVSYKESFIDLLTKYGALAIEIEDGYTTEQVIENVRAWMEAHEYTWNGANVATVDYISGSGDIMVAAPAFEVFNVVAIFSLIANAVGLCTIIYENISKRNREYGIYRAVGFDTKAIRDMVFVETFIAAFIGVFLGFVSGILIDFVLFEAISDGALLAITMSIPVITLSLVIGIMAIIMIVASYGMSVSVTRKTVVENVRYLE